MKTIFRLRILFYLPACLYLATACSDDSLPDTTAQGTNQSGTFHRSPSHENRRQTSIFPLQPRRLLRNGNYSFHSSKLVHVQCA